MDIAEAVDQVGSEVTLLPTAYTHPRYYECEVEELKDDQENCAIVRVPALNLVVLVPHGKPDPDGTPPSILWEAEHALFSPIRNVYFSQPHDGDIEQRMPPGVWPVIGETYVQVCLERGQPEGHMTIVQLTYKRWLRYRDVALMQLRNMAEQLTDAALPADPRERGRLHRVDIPAYQALLGEMRAQCDQMLNRLTDLAEEGTFPPRS